MAIILARQSEMDDLELKAAKKYFDVYHYHNDDFSGEIVIGRYSVLPFYKWVAEDLELKGCYLINSYEEHRYIADFDYYFDVYDLTPKTVRRLCDVDQLTFPIVVKGATNSRKFLWSEQMFAENVQQAQDIYFRLKEDSLIGYQEVIFREYVPLVQYEKGTFGLPITDEWRVFVYMDKVLSIGYYWTMAEQAPLYNLKGPDPADSFEKFVNKVIQRIQRKNKTSFYVLDIAKTVSGEWILIEVNDGQMSGLSMNDPYVLYKNLSEALNE